MKRRIFDLLGIEVIVNDADDWKRIRLTGRITEQVLSTVLAKAFAGFLVAYSAVLA